MPLDRFWNEAQIALMAHLREGATVLLPEGDWDALPFAVTTYRNSDVGLDPARFDAVLVHKGMLGSFRQDQIKACLAGPPAVFANDVFVLFLRCEARRPGVRASRFARHILVPLRSYADPARYRRWQARRCAFLHVPKAAGTSAWARISQSVRSKVYFASDQALSAFDGDINAFEVIGGHFMAETLLAKGWDGPVFFILRDPVERTLSFLAHARRATENVALFGPSYRLGRGFDPEAPSEALRDLLFHEANMQVRMLGERPGDSLINPGALDAMTDRAMARLERPGWSFGLVEQPGWLERQLVRQFGLWRKTLPVLNALAPTDRASMAPVATMVRRYFAEEPARCHDSALVGHAGDLLRRRMAGKALVHLG